MQFIQRGLSGLLETNGRLWLDYLPSFAVNYSVANLEASATEWLFFFLATAGKSQMFLHYVMNIIYHALHTYLCKLIKIDLTATRIIIVIVSLAF